MGADCVGTLGRSTVSILNIGLFSEEWLLHFRPFLGGQKISPIRDPDAEKNSAYWQATEDDDPRHGDLFPRHRSRRSPQGRARRKGVAGRAGSAAGKPAAVLSLPKTARRAIQANSPSLRRIRRCRGHLRGRRRGPKYRECWDRYWAWAQSASSRSNDKARDRPRNCGRRYVHSPTTICHMSAACRSMWCRPMRAGHRHQWAVRRYLG